MTEIAIPLSKIRRPRRTPKGRQVDPGAREEIARLLEGAPLDREYLIENLHRIQDRYGSLSAERLTCSTVLLTAALSDSDAVEGLRLGARGIVLKESPPDTLLECVRHVSRGEQWVDSETMTRALDTISRRESMMSDPSRTLTARELEIVRMIAQGLRNKAIAERLFISEGTVKIHLHNVYEKLGLDGRLELMLHAQKQGLV